MQQFKRRSIKGQSLVEYGIGIGCVAAVTMVALSGLGHASGDICRAAALAINDGNDHPPDAGWVVNLGATPWSVK